MKSAACASIAKQVRKLSPDVMQTGSPTIGSRRGQDGLARQEKEVPLLKNL